MAKDENTNDKDQDDFFGDDEDFGLPELDYEALDDDDDSSDAEESKAEEPAAEETPVEEPTAEETPVEEPKEEEFTAEDDSFMDDESIDDEEIPDQISDEELEASLADEDLGDLDDAFEDDGSLDDSFDDDTSMDDAFDEAGADDAEDKVEDTLDGDAKDEFYEEESFDDFDSSASEGDGGEEIPDSVFDSDVLDEDEFAQFEKELMETEEENVADMDTYESDYADAPAESKSKFAKVVVIGVLIFAALGAIFWFMSPLGGGEEEKPVAEKTTPKKAETTPEKKPEEKPEEKPAATTDTESQPASAANNANNRPQSSSQTNRPAAQPQTVAATPGTVNSLSARTGNFYVVIGSFLDGDMAMDYATKLSSQGKSPSIIPPFGNAVTHRVAIAGYGSLAESQQAVSGFKAEYGEDIWILKY